MATRRRPTQGVRRGNANALIGNLRGKKGAPLGAGNERRRAGTRRRGRTRQFNEQAGGGAVKHPRAAPGPIVLEISAGGAPIATAVGPRAVLFLDSAELAEGPLSLTAVAIDEAGNRSTPVSIEVVIEHEAEEEPPPEEEPAPE